MDNDFISCGKCQDGFIYGEDSTVTKCKCLLEYQRTRKLTHMLKNANIPLQISSDSQAVSLLDYSIEKDYVGSDKNRNIPKIKKFISKFDEKYSSLNMYWYSLNGMQKTTLAKVMCRDLIKKGKSVYYILADTLIKMLIDSERDDQLKEVCSNILICDFLVIDELDESKITTYKSGYQVAFITSFLKKRIESLRKSTLFCSNRKIDNMGNFFGEALQDLILREVLDPQTFEDNYKSKSKAFDVKTLWDD